MRIIIELDAGSNTPELQITTQGKTDSQNTQSSSNSGATGTAGKATDAGGPKYMSSGQTAQQPPADMPVSSMPEGSVSGTAAGGAPGEEG